MDQQIKNVQLNYNKIMHLLN